MGSAPCCVCWRTYCFLFMFSKFLRMAFKSEAMLTSVFYGEVSEPHQKKK